jgi:hypothetical protein
MNALPGIIAFEAAREPQTHLGGRAHLEPEPRTHSEPRTLNEPGTRNAARRTSLVLLLLAGALSAACHAAPPGELSATASDEWVRQYRLAADAELQIVGGNGSVEVTGGPGDNVDVRAERVAKAATEAMAREIVPRIEIREDVTPNKLVLQSEGLAGITIGVEIRINYKITMPRDRRLRVRTANGAITLSNIDGHIVASTSNGKIVARSIGAGGIEARTANAGLDIDLAALGTEPVDLRTANGSIDLTLPKSVDANLLLNAQNGKVDIDPALAWEPSDERNTRRLRGRLNAGGAPIEVTTFNGGIRIRPRP